MRIVNNEFSYQGPIKLLDFGNADVANIAGVIDGDLPVVQEVEEEMIANVNKATCTTKVNVGSAPIQENHFVVLRLQVPSFVIL